MSHCMTLHDVLDVFVGITKKKKIEALLLTESNILGTVDSIIIDFSKDFNIDGKQGANLLHRLVKDNVTFANRRTPTHLRFLPVLHNCSSRTNSFIYQLIV